LTSITRAAKQHAFTGGSQPAASWSRFWRFIRGGANVKLRRSSESRLRVAASAGQRPLSWASELATMCWMSVSRFDPKQRLLYGPYTPPRLRIMRSSTDWLYR